MQAGAVQPDAESLITQGIQFLNEDRNEEALNAFTRASEIAPDRPEAWSYRAETLVRLERFEEAADSVRASLDLDPTLPDRWYLLGEILYKLERMPEAADAYVRSTDIDPTKEDAWVGRIVAHILSNQSEKAVEAADQALSALPGNTNLMRARVSALKARVRRLVEEDQYENALAAADEALEAADESQRGSLLFFRASALHGLQRFQEVLDALSEAEKLAAPQTATFLFCLYRAVALTETGRFVEALSTIDGFNSRDESNEARDVLRLVRGMALNGLERHQEAYDSLSEIDSTPMPQDARAKLALHRAAALTGLKRYEEALSQVGAGLEQSPAPAVHMLLLFIRGTALNALARHAEALESLTEAQVAAPPPRELWPFWLQLAAAFNGLGRYAEAEEPLESATRTLASSVSGVDLRLGNLYGFLAAVRGKLGKTAESLDALEHAMAMLPEEAPFWLYRADLLQRLERLQEALDAYAQASRLEPGLEKNAIVWASRASMQLRLRQSDILPPSAEIEAHPAVLLVRGGALLNARQLNEGWDFVRRAQAVPPDFESDSFAWLACGITNVAIGKFREGVAALDKADGLTPGISHRPDILVWRALGLQGVRKSEEALKALDGVPDTAFSRIVKALALGDSGRNEEALAVLDGAPEIVEPGLRRRTGFFRSVFLMKTGRTEDALRALDETLEQETDPLFRVLVLSLKALVQRLLETENKTVLDTSMAVLGEAESIAASLPEGIPGKGFPSYARAVLLSSVNLHEEAVQAYQASEQAEPARASLVVNIGESLLALEDYRKALKCFERALAMPSDRAGTHFEALVGQGLAHSRREHYEEAVEAYRAALALPQQEQRDAVDAWTGLAEAYTALGRFHAAKENFGRAMNVSKNPGAVAARAGWAFVRAHREHEALEFLDQAKAAGRDSAKLDFNRGIALYRLKRRDDARAAWKSAAQAGSAEAKACLHELSTSAPGAAVLVDYWFGPERRTARKMGGGLLIAMAFAGGALPVLKLAAVPWIQTGAPWAVVTFPAVVAITLLFLPILSTIKFGPFELKLSPVEPDAPLPHASIEALIQQAISSQAAFGQTSFSFAAPVQPSFDTRVYAAAGVSAPVVMPVRLER